MVQLREPYTAQHPPGDHVGTQSLPDWDSFRFMTVKLGQIPRL